MTGGGRHTKPGEAFETEVRGLLQLHSGAVVSSHQSIAGKDVDLVVTYDSAFAGRQCFAVECKDYGRPLSRDVVTGILSSYEPVLRSPEVNGLLIVTRKGIVANASKAIEALPVQHKTSRELFEDAFGAAKLLQAATETFDSDGLSSYYEPAQVFARSLDLVDRNYLTYYSEFTDFCVQTYARHAAPDLISSADISYLHDRWRDTTATGTKDLKPRTVQRAVEDRLRVDEADLMAAVAEWLDGREHSMPTGLAVLGSYGTGKSTFARALAARQAARYRALESERIPFLIELRHFGSHQSLEGLIADELVNRHGVPNGSFAMFERLNRAGKLLVIFDGFDEMKEGMSHDSLAYNFAQINRLIEGRARVVLLGRPTIFESQTEQREMLADPSSRSSARYWQLTLAPMAPDTVQHAIRRYVSARSAELEAGIDERITELSHELERNEQLQELLSRPVHFPMLLSVLPRWNRKLRELGRAQLFSEFVDGTIAREAIRGRPGSVSGVERREFAENLAVEMVRAGDSRSIRNTLIPDEIVLPYKRAGQALDEVRRELVRACFLERKPPDILFFPHRSFAEFLVACRLSSEVRSQSPETERFGIRVTPEIGSFASELMGGAGWANVFAHPTENLQLMRYFCRASESVDENMREGLRHEGVGRALSEKSVIARLPSTELLHIACGLETVVKTLPAGDYDWSVAGALKTIADGADDNAAIHAYRGLRYLGSVIQPKPLEPTRLERWSKLGWI